MRIKTVKWSPYAKRDVRSIKEFFDKRNGSPTYSNKLVRLFQKSEDFLKSHPYATIETDHKNVRGHLILDYILFFSIENDEILMLRVWDTRRDPDQIRYIPKSKS